MTAGPVSPKAGPPARALPSVAIARVTHWTTKAAVRSAATSRGPSASDRQVSRAGSRGGTSVPSAVSGSTTAASLTRFPVTCCRKPSPNSVARLASSPRVSDPPARDPPDRDALDRDADASPSSTVSAACSRPMETPALESSALRTPTIFFKIIKSVARPAAVALASSACTTSTISDAIWSPVSPASSGVSPRSNGSS